MREGRSITNRIERLVDDLLASVGGKAESFYFAFGDTDAFVIVDVPDNVTAAAVALTVGASGLVNLKTTVLMTPEEVDQATKKSPAYRAPGA
ncbi:MAG: GYD domain-containing protein [Chloroflexi bacterium]|nr:MAG: GYD domain-containing protein [Chloroflexota bacterium]